MTRLEDWFTRATRGERERVALRCGTSVEYLRQLATGDRSPSVEMAARLAKALKREGLDIDRGQLHAVCATCPFYKHARKET